MMMVGTGLSGCITCSFVKAAVGAVGDASGSIANGVLSAFTDSMASTATWMINHISSLISDSVSSFSRATQIQLDSNWFTGRSGVMRQLALIVVGPMLAAASIGPVLRQDLHRLGRVWGVGLPVAVVSGVAAAKLTQYGLSINDALCSVVLANGAGSVGKQLDVVGASSMIPGAPALVTLLISCLLILGALALWLELLVRAAAVYVAVFFLPLTLACYVWPATVSIAKRSVEILVALILSKFVIVAVLTLGLSAVSHPSADSGLAGAVILLLAAFAPFVLLRLAPIVEVAAIAQLEGISRRPGHAASRAVGTAVAGPSHPLWQRLMASRSAQSKPPGSESVAAQPVATRSADYPLQAAAQSDARTRSARPDQAKSGG